MGWIDLAMPVCMDTSISDPTKVRLVSNLMIFFYFHKINCYWFLDKFRRFSELNTPSLVCTFSYCITYASLFVYHIFLKLKQLILNTKGLVFYWMDTFECHVSWMHVSCRRNLEYWCLALGLGYFLVWHIRISRRHRCCYYCRDSCFCYVCLFVSKVSAEVAV